VPEAVYALLPNDHENLVRAGEKEGKFYVDLREAIARRLVQLGLRRENILVSEECTVCSHNKYWSHRYTQGNRGSQAALIVI
jgi:copper oxidase (laccase) domain-containing protein